MSLLSCRLCSTDEPHDCPVWKGSQQYQQPHQQPKQQQLQQQSHQQTQERRYQHVTKVAAS